HDPRCDDTGPDPMARAGSPTGARAPPTADPVDRTTRKQAQGGAPVDPVPTPAPRRILPPASPRVPPDPRGSESSIQNGVPVFRSDMTRFSHSDLTRIPRSDVIGIPHLE